MSIGRKPGATWSARERVGSGGPVYRPWSAPGNTAMPCGSPGSGRRWVAHAITLSGTGTVIYNTALSPALPIVIGNLDVGKSVTTIVYLNVPSTVTRLSLTESGPVQDVVGTNYNYSTLEAVFP